MDPLKHEAGKHLCDDILYFTLFIVPVMSRSFSFCNSDLIEKGNSSLTIAPFRPNGTLQAFCGFLCTQSSFVLFFFSVSHLK